MLKDKKVVGGIRALIILLLFFLSLRQLLPARKMRRTVRKMIDSISVRIKGGRDIPELNGLPEKSKTDIVIG